MMRKVFLAGMAALVGLCAGMDSPAYARTIGQWNPSHLQWQSDKHARTTVKDQSLTVSNDVKGHGPWRMNRVVSMKAGELLFARITAWSPAPTTLKVHWAPAAHGQWPETSTQTFKIQPLPLTILAIFPAVSDGVYRITLSAKTTLTIQTIELSASAASFLTDAANPSLHAINVPAPKQWNNADGKYLIADGGTVAMRLDPQWIERLKGKSGGIFDAYLTWRMTADANLFNTYFMVMPPDTNEHNAGWERSHWKLDRKMTIGEPPDGGWKPAVKRWRAGETQFVAFTWKQFRKDDQNYLYTSYFANGQPYDARIVLLGAQEVAPTPKALYLGSMGGQPARYDRSAPAPMKVKDLLIYKQPLSSAAVAKLAVQLQSGEGPAATSQSAVEAPVQVTDSTLSNRIVNGWFELGQAGWGPRFDPTINGHPHGSWHGEQIGVDQLITPGAGIDQSTGLVFQLPRDVGSGKTITGDAVRLPSDQRFKLSIQVKADQPHTDDRLVVTLARHVPGEVKLARPFVVWRIEPGTTWQTETKVFDTSGEPSDDASDGAWYTLGLHVEGKSEAKIYVDRVCLAGPDVAPSPRAAAEPAVTVKGPPDGVITNAHSAPLTVMIACTPEAMKAPIKMRLRANDLFGHVFYDRTRMLPAQGDAASSDLTLRCLDWSVPTDVKGVWRVRVDTQGPWGHGIAECPVTVMSADAVSRQPDLDSFWGSEWLPTDQANDLARRMGIKWTKLMNVGTGYGMWPTIEITPDHYTFYSSPAIIAKRHGMIDFGDHTNFIERIKAMRDQGVLSMMTLIGAPKWRQVKESVGVTHSAFPADMKAWGVFVRKTVSHYRGLVPYYEVWNEPGWWNNNHALQNKLTYEDYARLVQTAINAMRETDPDAKIVYMDYMSPNPMTPAQRKLEATLVKQVDVVSFHKYFNALPPDEMGDGMFLRKLVQRYKAENPNVEVWNTEGGVRAGGWHPYRAPDTLEYPRGVPFETLRRGAIVPKAAVLQQAAGVSKWFFYFLAGNVGDRSYVGPGDYNGYFTQAGSFGTPLISGATTMAAASLLHGTHYVATIEKNPRVKFYLFTSPNRTLAFYWGRNFGKHAGKMTLATDDAPTVLDMDGNAIKQSSTKTGEWTLPLSNLVNVIRTDTLAQAKTVVDKLQLSDLPPDRFTELMAKPFKEKFPLVKGLASEQWFQVDLSKQANMGFTDKVAGDGKGGWTDEGPKNDLSYMRTGLLTLYGVPFNVIDPATNDGKSIIVLKAAKKGVGRSNLSALPSSVNIPVGRRSNVFYFLVASGWTTKPDVATLTIHYANDKSAYVALRNGKNVADWWHPPVPNSEDSRFVPVRKDRFIYVVQWVNPHPNESVKDIAFTSALSGDIPILLGITGHGTH